MRYAFLVLLILSAAAPAGWLRADTIYYYCQPFETLSPEGSPPWLRASFENRTDSSALLRLQGVNLPGAQFASKFYFNFRSDLDPSLLTMVHESGLQALAVETGSDSFKANGDGYYDIRFSFDTSESGNRFVHGSLSEYLISYAGDLPAGTNLVELFLCMSKPGGGHGPYYTAAHIQGIPNGSGDEDSAWVQGGITVPTPEPTGAALWILPVGLALLRRWRRPR